MNIYTTYFGKLRKLSDTIVPVNISRKPPVTYKGLSYLLLAPPSSILKAYKYSGDWDMYRAAYNVRVLHTLDPDQVISDLTELTDGRDAALVCFEKDSSMCHRSLVSAWLNQAGCDAKEL